MRAFQVLQRVHGPDPLPQKWTQGNAYALESGSLDLFVMDSRSQRALLPERRMMTEACWQRLKGWLEELETQQHAKVAAVGFGDRPDYRNR